MTNRRVVVTGIGVLSPIGNDINTFNQSLLKGKNGIQKIAQLKS